MKNIIISAASALALFSCAKQTTEEITPITNDAPKATISFVAAENSDQTRAFFDSSTATETWEQSLSSLTVFCFGEDGNLLIRRNFNADELSKKSSTFSLPRTSAGKSVEFFALANSSADNSISTKAALVALVESSPSVYNDTFANVSTKAVRNGGFLMSGSTTKTVAAQGATTDVSITLKRNVAKVAVQTSLSPDFSSKYPGSVKITSVKVTKAATTSPYFETTPKPAAMTYSATQSPSEDSGKFNSLFYLFENGTLAEGSRVMVTLEGIYDRDGNTSTTADQIPVVYELELSGNNKDGALLRNGYYRVAISLTGLTGQDVTGTITVAPWLTPITQTISIGQ